MNTQLIEDIDILEKGSKDNCDIVKKSLEQDTGKGKKIFIESYGCQMNFSDSEIIASIMHDNGYDTTSEAKNADVIFLNTCAIRDNAEKRIRNRLMHLKGFKKHKPGLLIGVLGCMAERLKKKLLEEEKMVDIVAGPDSYRDLPKLVYEAEDGARSINVFLSREETYADISPVRLNSNGITAMVSITRGCDNMCTFCVVPFTRGRERSRSPYSIIKECQDLYDEGYKEVTLLGQNVDSYFWTERQDVISLKQYHKALKNGVDFRKVDTYHFAKLLEQVALISPDLRVRFSTSHPKDITDEVLYTIKRHDNICNYIHLPVQSGNTRMLDLMNRTHDRAWYLSRIEAIKDILEGKCAISSDFIAGFCSETEEEHQETLSLMEIVQFDFSYTFFYSERPGTLAHKNLEDDIPLETKKRRLAEIIEVQHKHSNASNKRDIGQVYQVLVEGYSKKSDDFLQGRTSHNKITIFPKEHYKKGDYVNVKIHDCTMVTLFGNII